MIAFKTFTELVEDAKDILAQQKSLHTQLQNFINKDLSPEDIVQISELMVPESGQLTITVWYKQPAQVPEARPQPEEMSADVLARSLKEQERRALVETMVDEHMIRSDSS